MVPSVPLLFLGRALGGLSTSLLFSVFEGWMVTDFHNRALDKKGGDISRTFGLMSTLNSIAGITSGVVSEWLVSATGTRKSPFAGSVVLLGLAFWVISSQWVRTALPLERNDSDAYRSCSG
jgi:MFS family permease